jgi:hypothetical protein
MHERHVNAVSGRGYSGGYQHTRENHYGKTGKDSPRPLAAAARRRVGVTGAMPVSA